MNLAEREALMRQVRHRLRPSEESGLMLSEDALYDIKRLLMDYARAGDPDEPQSLAQVAYRAADAIGFLQFDRIDCLNEIRRQREQIAILNEQITRLNANLNDYQAHDKGWNESTAD